VQQPCFVTTEAECRMCTAWHVGKLRALMAPWNTAVSGTTAAVSDTEPCGLSAVLLEGARLRSGCHGRLLVCRYSPSWPLAGCQLLMSCWGQLRLSERRSSLMLKQQLSFLSMRQHIQCFAVCFWHMSLRLVSAALQHGQQCQTMTASKGAHSGSAVLTTRLLPDMTDMPSSWHRFVQPGVA
jgi:hypothetical protein